MGATGFSPSFYEILGVPMKATESEIKKAYRKLARELHPDNNPDDKQAEARLKEEVNPAHDILSDSDKRKKYDKWLKEMEEDADTDGLFGPTANPGSGSPTPDPEPVKPPPPRPRPESVPPPRPNPFTHTAPSTNIPTTSPFTGASNTPRWQSSWMSAVPFAVMAAIAIVAFAILGGHSSGCEGPSTHKPAIECPGGYNCGWYTLGNRVTESPVSNVAEPVHLMKVERVPVYYYGESDTKTIAHNVWMLTGEYHKTGTAWCRVITASTRKTSKLVPVIHGDKGMIQVLEQLPGCKLQLFYDVLDGSIANYQAVLASCKVATLEHEGFDPRPLSYGSGVYNPLTAESELK